MTALHVVNESDTGVDLAAAELAAADFLRALGVSLDTESLEAPAPGWPAPTPSCSPRARST